MDLMNARIGDKFAAITYHEYGHGIESAYTYIVIRAGKRDIVCHAIKLDGTVAECAHSGQPRKFKFRRADEVSEVDAPEIKIARQSIARSNRQLKCYRFINSTATSKFDEMFLDAIELFKERIAK